MAKKTLRVFQWTISIYLYFNLKEPLIYQSILLDLFIYIVFSLSIDTGEDTGYFTGKVKGDDCMYCSTFT